MLRLRRCAHLALALLLSIFSVAPHQHDGLSESFPTDRLVQVGKCDAPQERHFHAARDIHAQPCVACVRQHAAGALSVLVAAVERPIEIGAAVLPVVRTPNASLVLTQLRGPPA
jgi:hypothetical protein